VIFFVKDSTLVRVPFQLLTYNTVRLNIVWVLTKSNPSLERKA